MKADSVIPHSVIDPFDLYLDHIESMFKLLLHLLEANPVRADLRIFLLISVLIPLVQSEHSDNFFCFGSVRVHSGVVVVNL
jgi:hypothetical protein